MAAPKKTTPSAPPKKIGRDAENGRFIPIEKAKQNPKNAVVEVIKPKKK